MKKNLSIFNVIIILWLGQDWGSSENETDINVGDMPGDILPKPIGSQSETSGEMFLPKPVTNQSCDVGGDGFLPKPAIVQHPDVANRDDKKRKSKSKKEQEEEEREKMQ